MSITVTKKHWEDFFHSENLHPSIRKEIADSWIRCRGYNVNPFDYKRKTLKPKELEIKIRDNSELISIAKPIMENMYNLVAGSEFSIILTDKEGYLLEVIGDESIMKKADELNFIKGALWTEKEVGTNAIGTALYIDKPIQTIGCEHYRVNQHSWCCSAATIHNENNEIIGCLDMSGNYEGAHPHTLGMVLTGAYSIENQLALIKYNHLINATFKSMSDGIIIINENLKIVRVNDKACKILNFSESTLLNKTIKDIIKDTSFIDNMFQRPVPYHNLDCDFYLENNKRIKCSINAVPISISNKALSIAISFSTASSIHKVVNKVAGFKANYNFQDIITISPKMKKIIDYSKRASLSDCNVLIQGESGTGKELFAQSIHNYSKRTKEPFVAVNCGSIPKELMESEFFGYEKGAFTGALKEGNPGKFELADGGTIFLDEIGELPLDMQSKLLRVLDNKKIIRVGGNYEKSLNIRVIAATNRNLLEEIQKKRFREDLYYRLNVMNIKLISLKERPEDIELLINHFITRLNKDHTIIKEASADYIDIMKKHNWKGNVRELQNVVERSYYLCEHDRITPEYIDKDIVEETAMLIENLPKAFEAISSIISLEEIEKNNIKKALEENQGDVLKAATLLGMSRATIYRKIKKYALK